MNVSGGLSTFQSSFFFRFIFVYLSYNSCVRICLFLFIINSNFLQEQKIGFFINKLTA